MRIYAEQSQLMFECEHCKVKQEVAPAKSKRGFMRTLNAFARKHDWTCKRIQERRDSIALSATAASEIIKKLTESL